MAVGYIFYQRNRIGNHPAQWEVLLLLLDGGRHGRAIQSIKIVLIAKCEDNGKVTGSQVDKLRKAHCAVYK